MAYSDLRRDYGSSGTHQGTGKIVSDTQGIYDESIAAKYKVGTRLELGDGRVFYYALNAATQVKRPGVLLFADCDRAEDTTNANAAAAAIGRKETGVTTVGTVGADQFLDGYLTTQTAAGAGQTYKIRANDAASATAGQVYLYDGLVTALSITTDVLIFENPFYKVKQITTTAQEAWCLGVALIGLTASYYFWLQTYGPATVINNDGLGDHAKERDVFPHGSGCSTLSTQGKSQGFQVIGTHTIYTTEVAAANDRDLIHLNCWA